MPPLPPNAERSEVRCPTCQEAIEMNGHKVVRYQTVRCPSCNRRLHVFSVEPLVLQEFRTYGL